MSIEMEIHQALGLRVWFTGCCGYFDPTTARYCNADLAQGAAPSASSIVFGLARDSPASRAPDLPVRHGLSLVETLRKLACNVHCNKHQHPTVQANSVLSWLTAATQSPHLFALSSQLETSLRCLHITLPRLAEAVDTARWRQRVAELLHDLEESYNNDRETTNALEQAIIAVIDDMFDPYFQNFAHNVTQEVVDRLSRQHQQGSRRVAIQYPLVRFYRRPIVRHIVSPLISPLDLNFDSNSFPSPSSSPRIISYDVDSDTDTDTDTDSDTLTLTPTPPSTPSLPPRSPYRNSTIWTVSPVSPFFQLTSLDIATDTDVLRTSTDNDEPCPICIEHFHPDSSTRRCRTCGKFFHDACTIVWAHTRGRDRDVTCPCCRAVWGQVEREEGDVEVGSRSRSRTSSSSVVVRIGDVRGWPEVVELDEDERDWIDERVAEVFDGEDGEERRDDGGSSGSDSGVDSGEDVSEDGSDG